MATCAVPLPFPGSLTKILISCSPRKGPRQGRREGFIITAWEAHLLIHLLNKDGLFPAQFCRRSRVPVLKAPILRMLKA